MIRGTTPTLTFTLPFETTDIKRLWVIFSQRGRDVLLLDGGRCTVDGNKVVTKLTQEETLSLQQNSTVEIQLRVLMVDDTALASRIITSPVNRILKDGEI